MGTVARTLGLAAAAAAPNDDDEPIDVPSTARAGRPRGRPADRDFDDGTAVNLA